MASVLDVLFVDVTTRGLQAAQNQVRGLTGDLTRAGNSALQMRNQITGIGNLNRTVPGVGAAAGTGGGGGGLGAMMGAIGPAAAGLLSIGGALKAITAADPGLLDQFGVVLHDISGTVGQVLLPVVRPLVPVLRQVADVIAGLADAFAPVVQTIAGSVLPVVNQLVGAWGVVYGQLAGAVLPVFRQLAAVLGPLARVVLTLFEGLAPIGVAFIKLQATMQSVALGILSGLLPVVQVLAEVIGGLGTVVGEVVSLLADVLGALFSAVGELLSPLKDFVALLANGLAQAIRAAVVGFRLFVDTVRALFGLPRAQGVGTANSVGRGLINDTGTEDANSTFQRIQQAILKSGMPAEKNYDEEQLRELEKITKAVNDLATAVNAAKKVPEAAGDLAEGASRFGVFGAAGALASILAGRK
jgi:phage-related protein